MSTSIRRLIVSVCGLVAATCAAAVLPPAAGAWQYFDTNGQPGAVNVPTVFPFEDGRFTTYGPYLMFTSFDLPFVHRSPATSGDQAVMGTYVVQRWNGSAWYVASRQQTPAYTIPAGRQGVYLPKLWRSPGGNQLYNRGYFRVVWIVAWAADGVGLGRVTITPSRVSDFRCQQMLRPCHATARWVRLGRTFATGGGW